MTASGHRGSRVRATTEIEITGLFLRQWREEDLGAYARMCADPEVMRHFPYVLAREESEARVGRFVRHWEERGFGLWAVEKKASGAFIGFVGLQYNEEWSEREHKTEVGCRPDRACWNRGLAMECARASLCYGLEVLELECIVSLWSRRTSPPARHGEVRPRAAG